MRKFLAASVVVVGLLLATLLYERFFVESTIGPAAIAALSALALLFGALLLSLILHGTRFRGMVGNAWLTVASVFPTVR